MKKLQRIGTTTDRAIMVEYICLNCNRGFEINEDLELNYCPLCGMDIRGE